LINKRMLVFMIDSDSLTEKSQLTMLAEQGGNHPFYSLLDNQNFHAFPFDFLL